MNPSGSGWERFFGSRTVLLVYGSVVEKQPQVAHFQSGNRQDRIALNERVMAGPGEQTSREHDGVERCRLLGQLAKPWSAGHLIPRDREQKAQEGTGRETAPTADRGTLRRGDHKSP